MNGFIIGRYALYLIGISVLMVVLSILLVSFTSMDVGSTASVVPPIVASLLAGQTWFRRYKSVPTKSDAWKAGAVFAVLHAIWSVGMIACAAWLFPNDPQVEGLPLTDPKFIMIGGIVMLFLGLVVFVVCRFTYRAGAKQLAKSLAKADQ